MALAGPYFVAQIFWPTTGLLRTENDWYLRVTTKSGRSISQSMELTSFGHILKPNSPSTQS